jgi:hypothetical protein
MNKIFLVAQREFLSRVQKKTFLPLFSKFKQIWIQRIVTELPFCEFVQAILNEECA